MRKIILSMQMSLDGFATGPNDDMSWLPDFADDEAWSGMHREMWRQLNRTDTLLLGPQHLPDMGEVLARRRHEPEEHRQRQEVLQLRRPRREDSLL